MKSALIAVLVSSILLWVVYLKFNSDVQVAEANAKMAAAQAALAQATSAPAITSLASAVQEPTTQTGFTPVVSGPVSSTLTTTALTAARPVAVAIRPPAALSAATPSMLHGTVQPENADYASFLKPLRKLDGCTHIFLDFGSNRGDSIQRWYSGEFLREAKRKDLSPEQFCVLGFEPNPQWTHRLQTLQEENMSQGRKVVIFTETLAHTRFGTDDFFIDGLSTNSFGSSMFEFKTFKIERPEDQKKLDAVKGNMEKLRTKIKVWTVDVGVILQELFKMNPELVVFAKMDIEGGEWKILPHLMMNYQMCRFVDTLFMEWHMKIAKVLKLPLGVDLSLNWLLTSEACNINLISMD